MGIVPPGIAPWIREETMGYQLLPQRKSKCQDLPKDERPPLQGYGDNLQGSEGEESPFPVHYRSPVVSAHPLLNRPPNPALDIVYGKPPRPSVDYRLIGKDQR